MGKCCSNECLWQEMPALTRETFLQGRKGTGELTFVAGPQHLVRTQDFWDAVLKTPLPSPNIQFFKRPTLKAHPVNTNKTSSESSA